MKISQLAAATLVPATVAGAVFAAVPFAQAAPATVAAPASRTVVHHAAAKNTVTDHAAPAKPKHHRHHARAATAGAATASAGQASTSQASTGQASASQQEASPAAASPAVTSDTFNPSAVSSFESCVAWRESGDTPTDPDGLFGILPYIWQSLGYSGTAGQAPVSVQQQAFDRLYAEYGAKPWAPSDGC